MARSQRNVLAWLEREIARCRPLALRYFRSAGLRVERKADASPVTAADRAVEERLRRAISRAFPGEPIIGEEFGRSGRAGSTYWTVDPIDGTRAFSRGLPSWSIMVGRVERGTPVLGVCDFPALDTTIGVARGVPAYERRGAARVRLARPRPVRSLREAVLFHGGLRWWPAGRPRRRFEQLVNACYLERAYGDCFGYLWALRGYVDAVVDYGVKIWDMVPLAALARATGRIMTDFRGRPCWTGPETIFAAPALARQISRILR
jgi:fructose-1,6-bisphosphatase/inositol monophosphatase family enzyme